MNEEQEKEILNEAKIQTARHKKKIQIISLVAIIAVIAMATVACIPLIKALHSKAGIAALERKLDNYSGIVGVLIFTFIQALQVVITVSFFSFCRNLQNVFSGTPSSFAVSLILVQFAGFTKESK